MDLETLRCFFGWCTLINIGLLLFWFLFMAFAHDFVYQMHTKWFKLSKQRFDEIHYAGMAFFKICIFIFNFVPFVVLHVLDKS